jgi:tripartite-type tricarboxylate transporter receptor subunit TctC
VRALGVTTAKRSAQVSNVPTITESGIPGFEVALWSAMFAPAGVPEAILARLNADLGKVLNLTGTKQRLEENGVDAAFSTPEQLAAFVKSETVKWAKAVKDSGATAD